jgi:hypothetical protein
MNSSQLRLAVLLGITAHAPAWAVRLAYLGQPGQVLRYSFTLSAETEETAGGRAQTLLSHGSLDCTQEIVEVDAQGHLKVRMRFRNGLLTSSSGGHSVRFPLRLPAAEVLFDRTGNVLSAEPLPEPEPVPPPGERPDAEMPGPATDSAAQARAFAALFGHLGALAFPDREVQVGDSWSLSSNLIQTGGEPGTATGVSRLTGVEQRKGIECAVIQSRLEVPLSGAQQLLGMSASTRGKSTTTLTAYFDLAGGHLLELLGTERSLRTIRLTPAAGQDAQAPQPASATLECECTATFTMLLGSTDTRHATP